MSDAELIKFGKEVRRLAENPFQRQLERGESGVEAPEEKRILHPCSTIPNGGNKE